MIRANGACALRPEAVIAYARRRVREVPEDSPFFALWRVRWENVRRV
jgi:hypothetical protein